MVKPQFGTRTTNTGIYPETEVCEVYEITTMSTVASFPSLEESGVRPHDKAQDLCDRLNEVIGKL